MPPDVHFEEEEYPSQHYRSRKVDLAVTEPTFVKGNTPFRSQYNTLGPAHWSDVPFEKPWTDVKEYGDHFSPDNPHSWRYPANDEEFVNVRQRAKGLGKSAGIEDSSFSKHNGGELFLKKSTIEPRGIHREELTSRLAHVMGMGDMVAPVRLYKSPDDDNIQATHYMVTPRLHAYTLKYNPNEFTKDRYDRDIARMRLFDSIVGNWDRHPGNIMGRDGKLFLIDHGYALHGHPEPKFFIEDGRNLTRGKFNPVDDQRSVEGKFPSHVVDGILNGYEQARDMVWNDPASLGVGSGVTDPDFRRKAFETRYLEAMKNLKAGRPLADF